MRSRSRAQGAVSAVIALVAAVAATAVLAAGARADAVYHTARLPLAPLASAPGGGMVVNAHANGPTVYAHEVYMLKGAAPGTYQVALHIDASGLTCKSPTIVIPTATLTTNHVGNGAADFFFTPADAGGLRGTTVSAFWTVTGPATYATSCTTITLD
jgi:hypothetical protein